MSVLPLARGQPEDRSSCHDSSSIFKTQTRLLRITMSVRNYKVGSEGSRAAICPTNNCRHRQTQFYHSAGRRHRHERKGAESHHDSRETCAPGDAEARSPTTEKVG